MVSCHICVDLTEGPPPSVTVTAQGTTSPVKGSRFLEAETEQQLVLTPDRRALSSQAGPTGMAVCEGALTEPPVHETEAPGLAEAKGSGPAPPLHSPTNISLKTYLNGEAKDPLPPARAVSQDLPPIPARAHGAGTTVPISQIEGTAPGTQRGPLPCPLPRGW